MYIYIYIYVFSLYLVVYMHIYIYVCVDMYTSHILNSYSHFGLRSKVMILWQPSNAGPSYWYLFRPYNITKGPDPRHPPQPRHQTGHYETGGTRDLWHQQAQASLGGLHPCRGAGGSEPRQLPVVTQYLLSLEFMLRTALLGGFHSSRRL